MRCLLTSVQRFLTLLLVMLAVTMLIFGLMHAVPGGPFDQTQQPLPGPAMANIMRKYGLDEPIWRQYLNWLWALLHGDFGIPFEQPTMSVTGLIAKAWPITFIVGGMHDRDLLHRRSDHGLHRRAEAQHLAGLAAHLGGVDGRAWHCPTTSSDFVLISVFSVKLGWLPAGGWGQPQDLILPVIAFALYPMALMARFTRASTLEVTYADYVRMGRARGFRNGG